MRSAHHRRSIRLPGYDYTQPGAYFVTICTRDRQCLFGQVVGDEVRLNPLGQIAAACLAELPSHFPDVELDEWVVMPNHVHMILVLTSPDRGAQSGRGVQTGRGVQLNAPTRMPSPKKGTVAVMIRTYKAAVTTLARREHLAEGVWQRNYYERIIRTEAELRSVREYIAMNPLGWERDEENPDRT